MNSASGVQFPLGLRPSRLMAGLPAFTRTDEGSNPSGGTGPGACLARLPTWPFPASERGSDEKLEVGHRPRRPALWSLLVL